MHAGHAFWWLMTMACVTWYSSVTVYVAIRGAFDIRHMLQRLAARRDAASPPGQG